MGLKFDNNVGPMIVDDQTGRVLGYQDERGVNRYLDGRPMPSTEDGGGQVVRGVAKGLLIDAQLPNDAFAKVVVLQGSGWEGTLVQEPSVWYDEANKRYGMYYNGAGLGGIAYAYNDGHPLNDPWVKVGSGPIIASTAHSYCHVEGRTLHLYTPVGSNLAYYTASMDSPQVLTLRGNAITGFPSGTDAWGNPSIVKDPDGRYSMFLELRQISTNAWRVGRWRSATLDGPFVQSGAFPIASLHEGLRNGSIDQAGRFCGGSFVVYEDGGYTMIYHGGFANILKPTEFFKARSVDGNTWVVLNGGFPIMRRTARFEDDQVADFHMVSGPHGDFAFWTGYNNNVDAPVSAILGGQISYNPVQVNAGAVEWFETDRYLGAANLVNREWASFELSSNAVANLPVAAIGVKVRVTNAGTTPNGTTGAVVVTSRNSDRIIDPANGNEVTTLNVPVGQTKTFVCRRFIGGAGAHVCWSVI